MITSFEVGAIFKIIDQASPALGKILRQIRELNLAIDKAKTSMESFGVVPVGLTSAVAQTDLLAAAWKGVATNAAAAQRALGGASAAAARTALPSAAAAATGGAARPALPGAAAAAAGGVPPVLPPRTGGGVAGGGGRHQPGWLGGARAHVYGPGVSVPGGGHIRVGGGGPIGGAMAGAGLLGYGVYEAAEMEDAVFQLIYHSGLEQNDANRAKFRKVLQGSMAESGYSLRDISESAKQEVRMFAGTPGHGIDVLPEMLRASTIEARLKGESPQESMRALIGLAHMTKQYSPEQIKKLAPAFAYLSTANPSSLSSIERAAGYAVPLLQSGLEIDPMDSLLFGTALTRAGATNTKSGTWLREMALRAMPGTSMMSKMAFAKHEAALKELGLVDDAHRPTWFTDGKPDLLKMLDLGGANAQKIPLERRAALERQLFGAQGGGGFALLADPAVREQILALRKERDSPEFKNRYGSFVEAYREGSTVQQARTAMAEFSIVMQDLGKTILPSVNAALKDFKSVLEGLRNLLPSGNTAQIGARAIEGAAVGAAAGSVVPGVGTVAGAAAGGVLGTALGYLEQQAKEPKERPADRYARRIENLKAQGGTAPMALPPIHLNLNIDGRLLGQAVTDALGNSMGFSEQAPSADGMSQPYSGDHNFPSK